jgi:ferrochelatase
MTYYGNEKDVTNTISRVGVLLVNLGTPDKPVCPSLRKYLGEFLMDPRVIELPALFRTLLVKGIIVNFRSHKSAATYREIWTDDGSPLLINSENLTTKTAEKLGNRFEVEVAMRYGTPSIDEKLKLLQSRGIRKLIVLPLYPQYSGATNGSTFDAIAQTLSKFRWVPSVNFISDYYQYDNYIKAVGDSILKHWENHGRNQKLLMSFHGVPQKYITRGDPYQSQCVDSAQRIADYLNLDTTEWQLVFQSRFGAEQWLQPYCDQTLKELPAQGVKSVDIVCPGFSVDCLETLEEIKGENKEYFMQAGGENYSYISCLNNSDDHAALIADVIKSNS